MADAKKAFTDDDDGGGHSVHPCLDALKQLKGIPGNIKELMAANAALVSFVGTYSPDFVRLLIRLTHDPNGDINVRAAASDMLRYCEVVVAETKKRKSIIEDHHRRETNATTDAPPPSCKKIRMTIKKRAEAEAQPLPPPTPSAPPRAPRDLHHTSSSSKRPPPPPSKVKVSSFPPRAPRDHTFPSKPPPSPSSLSSAAAAKPKTTTMQKKRKRTPPPPVPVVALVPNKPPSPAALEYSSPAREKIRSLLEEAFSRVSSETELGTAGAGDAHKAIQVLVGMCDPTQAAEEVESVLFRELGSFAPPNKNRYWAIMSNLRDSKNPDLRRRVLIGHVKPQSLLRMTHAEMASDERKHQDAAAAAAKEKKKKMMKQCSSHAAVPVLPSHGFMQQAHV